LISSIAIPVFTLHYAAFAAFKIFLVSKQIAPALGITILKFLLGNQFRHAIGEDNNLFGFLDEFQRRLFDLLREVKGCGPKIGLALIGQLGEQTVAQAILAGDARTLSIATGVGPRLAERINLELKNKIADELALRKIAAAVVSAGSNGQDSELVETLIALGYRRPEAESAAHEAPAEGTLQERLKLALRSLAR
jgi:Holliday junction DNA helicase RuvA